MGRWVPFWKDGIKIAGKYTIIEPTPSLAAEAEKRFEARADVEVILGHLAEMDRKLGKRKWDLGFTFTSFEHMPPPDAAKAARIFRQRVKRMVMVEMTQESKQAQFCGYVFKHDYRALFGEPSFQKMLDPNKTLFIYD